MFAVQLRAAVRIVYRARVCPTSEGQIYVWDTISFCLTFKRIKQHYLFINNARRFFCIPLFDVGKAAWWAMAWLQSSVLGILSVYHRNLSLGPPTDSAPPIGLRANFLQPIRSDLTGSGEIWGSQHHGWSSFLWQCATICA